ncbi:MAG: hypothetical protein WCT01_03265 [Candidatus Shapirobacteria bacterium]
MRKNSELFNNELKRFPELVVSWDRVREGVNWGQFQQMASELKLVEGRINRKKIDYSNLSVQRYERRSISAPDSWGVDLEPVSMWLNMLLQSWVLEDETWMTVELEGTQSFDIQKNIIHRVAGYNQNCIARVLTMARERVSGETLAMVRRRGSEDSYEGKYEIAGGKVLPVNYYNRGHQIYGVNYPNLPAYLNQGEVEMGEEMGELVPSGMNRVGLALTLAGQPEGRLFFEVTEVAIVEPATLWQMAALANSRSGGQRLIEKRGLDKEDWGVMPIPGRVKFGEMLPTTDLVLRRLVGGETVNHVGDWWGNDYLFAI